MKENIEIGASYKKHYKMNMEMSNQGDLLVLTPVETAKLLRISRGTVYEQIRLGVIPSIRCGRRILVPKAALIKMLEGATGDGSHLG